MNFTNAAAELGISQPAVSQHIRHLEEDYGIKLFRYEGKRLRLTEEGKLMLDAVQTINNDEHILRERIRAMQSHQRMYRFGTTHTIMNYLILDKLAEFLRMHPHDNVSVTSGDTMHLLEAIDDGKIDFAIVEGAFDHSRYETLPFATERLLCVCGKDFKIADEVDTAELFKHRILTRGKTAGSRQLLDTALATINCSVESFASHGSVGTPYAVKMLAMQNCGIAFLYESAVKKEIENGDLRRIRVRNFAPVYNFTFLWKQRSMYKDDFLAMYKFLRSGEVAPPAVGQPIL